jgi:cystathionine beta-lyase
VNATIPESQPPNRRRGRGISAQALTKFPSGGGDVLRGSLTTRDHALHLRL